MKSIIIVNLLALTLAEGVEYITEGCVELPESEWAIENCACHSSCKLCGYMVEPMPTTENHCVTCSNSDHILVNINMSGSGTCKHKTE